MEMLPTWGSPSELLLLTVFGDKSRLTFRQMSIICTEPVEIMQLPCFMTNRVGCTPSDFGRAFFLSVSDEAATKSTFCVFSARHFFRLPSFLSFPGRGRKRSVFAPGRLIVVLFGRSSMQGGQCAKISKSSLPTISHMVKGLCKHRPLCLCARESIAKQ